jgi:hypothetical protein
MDWWTKFEGKEQESCIQGRRVTKSLANAGRFTSVIVRGSTRVKRSTRQCCRGVERIRVSRGAATFPTGRVVSVLWGRGAWQESK